MLAPSRLVLLSMVLGLMGACSRSGSKLGTVAAQIQDAPSVRGQCLVLRADTSEKNVSRDGGTQTVVVTAPIGADIELQAEVRATCEGAVSARSERQRVRVSGGQLVSLTLVAVRVSGDSDGDGFAAKDAGGTDCDDSRIDVYPAAAERCGSGLDVDCDGRIGCEDSDCATDMRCRLGLRFELTPEGFRRSCLTAVVTRLGLGNQPQAPPQATPLTITPTADFEVFSDEGCQTPTTTLSLSQAQLRFGLRANRVGTLQATARLGELTATASTTIAERPGSVLLSGATTSERFRCVTLQLEAVDDIGQRRTVASQLTTSAGVTLFTDGGCSQPLDLSNGVLIPDVPLTIGARFEGASPATITARAPAFDAGVLSVNLSGGAVLAFGGSPSAVIAGACVPFTLSRQQPNGNPWAQGLFDVDLRWPTNSGISVHDSSSCDGPEVPSRHTFADGESTKQWWLRGLSAPAGTTVLLEANEVNQPVGGRLSVQPLPFVQLSSCTLLGQQTTCGTIGGAPVGNTFLVTQAAVDQGTPNSAAVSCELNNSGQVVCQRYAAGLPATVSWQAVTWAGASVTHFGADAGSFTSTAREDVLFSVPGLVPTDSLVFLNSWNGGVTFGGDDVLGLEVLPNVVQVHMAGQRFDSGSVSMAIQVVQLAGSKVTHASLVNETVSAFVGRLMPGLSVANGFVLGSGFSRPIVSGTALLQCASMLRFATSASGVAQVFRGLSQSACDIHPVSAWAQRVEMPNGFRVSERTLDLNQETTVLTLPAAPHRVAVWATNQSVNGQSGGEAGNTASFFPSNGTIVLEPAANNTLVLKRRRFTNPLKVTLTLLEFAP